VVQDLIQQPRTCGGGARLSADTRDGHEGSGRLSGGATLGVADGGVGLGGGGAEVA
jgi:hypothetical protein